MKHAYFHMPSADNDDVALGEAKVLGHVPPTCLLGGIHVWNAVKMEQDPCAGCHGPRARCGGRPQGDARFTMSPLRRAELLAMIKGDD